MMLTALTIVNIFILIYFIALSLGYILLLILSIPDTVSRYKEIEGGNLLSIMRSYSLPPVTVIMPAYNEQNIIIDAVDSILMSSYINTHLVIVNDGSTDGTLKQLINKYDLVSAAVDIEKKIPTSDTIKGYYIPESYRNLTVIDKSHTDRSDSMNIGLNVCKSPLVLTVDADTIVEPDAVSRIVFYILSKPNLDAVGGGVYILNGCTYKDGKIIDARISMQPIFAIQACEYLRSFLFSKSGWNPLSGALCYSGTFTIFKTESVVRAGGFDRENLAQDFEIITRLRANQYEQNSPASVGYTSAAIVWTDVPGTLKEYWNQRFNWQYFTLHSLMPYKRMLFNAKYGIVGFFTYPFFLFGETLGCLVEFTAYLSIIVSLLLGVFDFYTAAILYAFAWGFFTLITMATALINYTSYNRYRHIKDLFAILFYTLFESFGFRQFNVTCRVVATISYLFTGGKKREEYAYHQRA